MDETQRRAGQRNPDDAGGHEAARARTEHAVDQVRVANVGGIGEDDDRQIREGGAEGCDVGRQMRDGSGFVVGIADQEIQRVVRMGDAVVKGDEAADGQVAIQHDQGAGKTFPGEATGIDEPDRDLLLWGLRNDVAFIKIGRQRGFHG